MSRLFGNIHHKLGNDVRNRRSKHQIMQMKIVDQKVHLATHDMQMSAPRFSNSIVMIRFLTTALPLDISSQRLGFKASGYLHEMLFQGNCCNDLY